MPQRPDHDGNDSGSIPLGQPETFLQGEETNRDHHISLDPHLTEVLPSSDLSLARETAEQLGKVTERVCEDYTTTQRWRV